jgi:hypothetical protein
MPTEIKQMKNIVLFSLALIIFTNCQKEKMNIPDTGRKIVLNGFITTDTLFNLLMGESAYLTDLSTPSYMSLTDLDSLKVRVYDNNKIIDSLSHNAYSDLSVYDYWKMFTPGNYWSRKVRPVPGRSYKVVASKYGLPDAYAVTSIPALVSIMKIDTLHINVTPGTFYDTNVGMQFKIEFSDPANETNYYLFKMYINTYWDPESEYNVNYNSEVVNFISEDPIIEEKMKNGNGLEAIAFSDKVINGQKHALNVIVNSIIVDNPDVVQTWSQTGNISYASPRKTVYFKFYSITEEYFKYIQTLQVYGKKYGNPLADPVLVPSNVSGGYGMFTGAAVSTDSIVFTF